MKEMKVGGCVQSYSLPNIPGYFATSELLSAESDAQSTAVTGGSHLPLLP